MVALYAPVLRFGLVAEDFQFALKGAKVAEDPLELFRPFQLVWRPAVYAVFAVLARAAGPLPVWYRIVQMAAGLALGAAGWLLLRRVAGLGPWLSAATVVVWLASPLANEPLCGEASFVGHLLFGASALLALSLHAGAPSGTRRLGVALALLVAAACKEEWIVVPAMLLLEDLALHGVPLRRALGGARWWFAGAGVYLAVYGAITRYRYAGVYHPSAGTIAAKTLHTLTAFVQLSEPLPWGFGQALAEAPWKALAAALILAAIAVVAVARRLRRPLLLLACCALSALPTLPTVAQAGRWTFLPWLFFLGGVVAWVREASPRAWRRPAARASAAVLLAVVAARGAATTRGDIADWGKLDLLTAALRREAGPLVEEAARGRGLVVLRLDDSGPWAALVSEPEGQTKAMFPRPDDPYGIVSLSALLSWETYAGGWVLERVAALPEGAPAVAFLHSSGGFRRLDAVPAVAVRHPIHPGSGVPGVILHPRSWAGFAPREFP